MIGPALIASAGCVASALLLALFGRVEWPFVVLGWVALVPWLALLDRSGSYKTAFAIGLTLNELFIAVLFPWIPDAITDYSGASALVAIGVTIGIAPLLQPQFVLSAVVRHRLRVSAGRWTTAFGFACAYVAAEGLFPKLFGDTIGQALHASPLLRQAADIGGAHGLTFALLLVNESVLAACSVIARRDRAYRSIAVPVTIVVAVPLLLAAYGAVRLRQLAPHDGAGKIVAGIVQANVSHYDRMAEQVGTFEAVRRILDPHFALSGPLVEAHEIDLLVWPETVYPTSFANPKSDAGAAFDRAIAALVAHSGIPLVFGTYEREGADEFNVAVLLEASADAQVTFDSYRKTNLFPFTEYLPAWLESDWARARWPWAGRWKPGSGSVVLRATLPGGRPLQTAPLICYDAIDPSFILPAVRQGAEILTTLSNDSWFAYPGVQRLILIVSAFRSIETRRPQLRATPTGISAAIDATGTITQSIAAGTQGTIVTATTLPQPGLTPFVRWGNWVPLAAGAICCALLAMARVARVKSE